MPLDAKEYKTMKTETILIVFITISLTSISVVGT